MSVSSLRAVLHMRPLHWRIVENVLHVDPHDCRWVYGTALVTTLLSSLVGKNTLELSPTPIAGQVMGFVVLWPWIK